MMITLAIICIGDYFSFSVLSLSMFLLSAVLIFISDGHRFVPGNNFAIFISLCESLYVNFILNKNRFAFYLSELKLRETLYSMESEDVITRVQNGESVADSYSEISIIFIDMVGFTELSKTITATHVLIILNKFFGIIEICAERFGIEKVKTIGDAYFAVAGARNKMENPADVAIAFSKEVLNEVSKIDLVRGQSIHVRIGINTGSAIGGVIGRNRWTYDFWGESVNLTSRIQSCAEPGTILISESTFKRSQGTISSANQ